MRKWILGWIAGFLAAGVSAVAARPERGRNDWPEPRRAPGRSPFIDAEVRPASVASRWLWSEPGQCRVAAVWGEALVGARMGSVLKVSVREAQRLPAVAARAAAWVAREQIEMGRAHDADLAAQLITFERGAAAVVRILRSPPTSSRRARLGAQALAA